MKGSGLIAHFILIALWFIQVTSLFSQEGFAHNSNELNQDSEKRFNHVISGTATFLPDGVPFEGLKISFSDVGETTVGPDGTYSMEVPRHWSGFATPCLCAAGGYIFNPPQIEYVDVRFDFPDENYTGEATTTYSISGRFYDKDTGDPLANTEIKFNLTGNNQADEMYITTNAFGEYSFEKLPCWGDTLDPFLNGYYYFEPINRGYADLSSDLTDQDFEVINYEYPVPPEWETINTGSFAFISIEKTCEPDICGNAIEIGDLLGVFYTDDNGELKCGGYTRWQDETNGFISAHGDDNTTPEKDGFSGGEPYTWMVYSFDDQNSSPASVELVSGNNAFFGLGLTKIGGVDGLIDNKIYITEGWSGISSFTMPDIFPALITHITDPISNELVIIQDMEKMYYPDAGINNLILWKYQQGYKIKLNADAVLPMTGCPEEDRTVVLNTAWNIMPVLSECPVPVNTLFETIIDQLIMVKEIGGTRIFWPAMNIQSLYVLEPGKAYYVAVSQNTSVDFEACSPAKNSTNTSTFFINTTSWNNPSETGSSHVIAITANAIDDYNAGGYIGAFTENDVCAGIVRIEGNQNVALTVFEDDPLTEKVEGFLQDEIIQFRLFETQTGEQHTLHPTFDPASPVLSNRFVNNGISMIKHFMPNPSSISNPNDLIIISPNPARNQVTIGMDLNEKVFITIMDARGGKMLQKTIFGSSVLDLSEWPGGIYIVNVESAKTTQTAKLVVK